MLTFAKGAASSPCSAGQLGAESATSLPSPCLQAQPDMLMFAKGIASGFPFAGVSARPELYSKMSPGMMVSRILWGRRQCALWLCWEIPSARPKLYSKLSPDMMVSWFCGVIASVLRRCWVPVRAAGARLQ